MISRKDLILSHGTLPFPPREYEGTPSPVFCQGSSCRVLESVFSSSVYTGSCKFRSGKYFQFSICRFTGGWYLIWHHISVLPCDVSLLLLVWNCCTHLEWLSLQLASFRSAFPICVTSSGASVSNFSPFCNRYLQSYRLRNPQCHRPTPRLSSLIIDKVSGPRPIFPHMWRIFKFRYVNTKHVKPLLTILKHFYKWFY